MKKIFVAFIVIISFWISTVSFAVQTIAPPSVPKLFLTWSSNTYVPPGFAGKIMPTANSQITASVELIDGGKIIDLSRQNVYWYVNNNFLSGGIGLQSVTFRAPEAAGGMLPFRVEVPDYSKGDQLKTIEIPIVRPEAIIEMPFPSGKFSSSPLQLIGQPYFFNADTVSKLIMNWNVNGQTPSGAENPQTLNVKFGQTIAPGLPVSVSLSINNTKSQYESASNSATLIYNP